jgi:Fe-S-cluster-containing dehydrogenase component
MSCNTFHGLTDVHRRNVITIKEGSDALIYFSISCNHCLNPVCISICPQNNYQKRSDGVVILDSNRCQACMRCVTACPFHAPKINPRTNRVDKCNLCVERLDQGLKPVCVENCITNAIGIIEVNMKERKTYDFREANIPLVGFTNPSVLIKKKLTGLMFLREG